MEWYEILLETSVTLYCYNKEAVDYTNRRWIGRTPKWADMQIVELKQLIADLMRDHSKNIRVEHVDGHQDKKSTFEELPLSAQVNVLCDRECTKQLDMLP